MNYISKEDFIGLGFELFVNVTIPNRSVIDEISGQGSALSCNGLAFKFLWSIALSEDSLGLKVSEFHCNFLLEDENKDTLIDLLSDKIDQIGTCDQVGYICTGLMAKIGFDDDMDSGFSLNKKVSFH